MSDFLPARESHVRELLKIESDEDRAAVWKSVVDRGETITAKVVEEEVKRHIALSVKSWLTLEEWNKLDDAEKERLGSLTSTFKLTPQDSNKIEWAQFSWNPVTGCKHDCPYCYARDMAMRFYPQGL